MNGVEQQLRTAILIPPPPPPCPPLLDPHPLMLHSLPVFEADIIIKTCVCVCVCVCSCGCVFVCAVTTLVCVQWCSEFVFAGSVYEYESVCVRE